MSSSSDKAGIHQSPIDTLIRLRNGFAIVAWAQQGSRSTLSSITCLAIVPGQVVRGQMSRAHIHILTREHTNTYTHTRPHTQVINDSPIQLHVLGTIIEHKKKDAFPSGP